MSPIFYLCFGNILWVHNSVWTWKFVCLPLNTTRGETGVQGWEKPIIPRTRREPLGAHLRSIVFLNDQLLWTLNLALRSIACASIKNWPQQAAVQTACNWPSAAPEPYALSQLPHLKPHFQSSAFAAALRKKCSVVGYVFMVVLFPCILCGL